MTAAAEIQVAIAIMYQRGHFLLQLRDDIPSIVYPGHWAFFGGHLEPNESPEIGLWRELEEELVYQPPLLHWWQTRQLGHIQRHIFHAPLTVALDQLTLQEGWDLGLVSPAEIEARAVFSARAGRSCPISPVHAQILIDFMHQERCWQP